MQEWTGIETAKERKRLERESATTLGYMLFEYSFLERDLGLLLIWANDGRDLELLAKKTATTNFKSKLDALEDAVHAKFGEGSDACEAYAAWMRDADQIRSTRNQLFHGRWGANATRQTVSCVLGLPGYSSPQVLKWSSLLYQSYVQP